MNYKVLIFSILFLSLSLQAEDPGKASYNFSADAKELESAEERLRALEKDLLKKIEKQEEARPVSPIKESKVIQELNQDNKTEIANAAIEDNQELKKDLQEQVQKLTAIKLQESVKREAEEKLAKENMEVKARLLLAEAEVQRLGSILDDQNNKLLGIEPAQQKRELAKNERVAEVRNISVGQAEKAESDMPIATVNAVKANLRTGPGAEHAPLMEVAKGSRLVVETRIGNWYRVIAPNGSRAWISSDVVLFGPSKDESPTRTVKIKGFDSSIEDRAMDLIKQK